MCNVCEGAFLPQHLSLNQTPSVINPKPNPHHNPKSKVGEITAYIRGETKADASEARVIRKRKAQERYVQALKLTLTLTLGLTLTLTHIVNLRYDKNVRKKAKHAAKRDHAEEILGTSLVTSVAELETQLQARCTSSSARTSFLRDQFHARVSGETPRLYPGIGPEYRSKFGKLKLTPSDGTTNKEQGVLSSGSREGNDRRRWRSARKRSLHA